MVLQVLFRGRVISRLAGARINNAILPDIRYLQSISDLWIFLRVNHISVIVCIDNDCDRMF